MWLLGVQARPVAYVKDREQWVSQRRGSILFVTIPDLESQF